MVLSRRGPLSRSGATAAHHQAETGEAHYQQRQRGWHRSRGDGSDLEREAVGGRARSPGPFVGAGGYAARPVKVAPANVVMSETEVPDTYPFGR